MRYGARLKDTGRFTNHQTLLPVSNSKEWQKHTKGLIKFALARGGLALWHSRQSAGSRSDDVPFVQRTFSGNNAAKLEGLRWVSKIRPDFNFAL